MLSQPYRFHGHSSLSFVFRKGHSVRGSLMMVRTIRNDRQKNCRVAIIVSKKIAKRAHDRNLVRRRLYEVMRAALPNVTQPYDIAIMVTNKQAVAMPYAQLQQELLHLLGSAQIMRHVAEPDAAMHDGAKTLL